MPFDNSKAHRLIAHFRAWRRTNIVKGTFTMTIGMGLRTVGQAGVFLIVARLLGTEAYGSYAAVLALAMTFGGFSGLGVSMIMLRDTARNSDVFIKSWERTLGAFAITAPTLLLLYLFLAWEVLPRQISLTVIICFGIAEILFAPLTLVSIQAYQGHERIGRAARLVLAPAIPRLVAAALFLIFTALSTVPERLPVWAILYLAASFTASLYALRLLRRDLNVRLRPRLDGLRLAFQAGWPFSVGGAAQKIYTDIDKTMLARLSTLESTGAYSAAYRITDMVLVPLNALYITSTARFFRAGTDGTRRAAYYGLTIFPLPLAYALAAGIVLYALAGLVPVILGGGYASAVGTLRWLAWLPLLTVPREVLHKVLSGSGRQHAAVAVLVAGAMLNIALNLLAIPRWGWRGAAGSTYVSEILMSIMLILLVMLGDKGHKFLK